MFLFLIKNQLHHQVHIFVKGFRNKFYIDTTPFLNCKEILNYKLNLLSRIEYKC